MPMNKNKKVIFPKTELKMTVFQALTLLAKKYQFDQQGQSTREKITALYLSGVRNENDNETLNGLLQDNLLTDYRISADRSDINEDPVRRYFESQLCYQTLLISLDNLDMGLLEGHFRSILETVSIENRMRFLKKISHITTVNEYTEGIRRLRDPGSETSFKPEKGCEGKTTEDILIHRKKKMSLLARCAYSSTIMDKQSISREKILAIYHQQDSVYDAKNRGRLYRVDKDTGERQTVRSQVLGIIRSYMPLPRHDILLADHPARYTRSTDRCTYAEGAVQIPDQIFSTKITPFVTSISGTMLIHLRVIARLLRENQFVYVLNTPNPLQENEQLEYYLKLFVAYMIYHSGGHSLDEYMSVLQLPEVQLEFKELAGFSSLTLDHLFKHKNKFAFNAALDQTIQYNDIILNKKKLHGELITFHAHKNANVFSPGVSSLSVIIGSMLILHLPQKAHKKSIVMTSILGGAILIALIGALIKKQLLAQKQNNGIAEVCLAAFMVALSGLTKAHIIGEKTKKTMTQCLGTFFYRPRQHTEKDQDIDSPRVFNTC